MLVLLGGKTSVDATPFSVNAEQRRNRLGRNRGRVDGTEGGSHPPLAR
jgi:hypothetical protein